jgi:hypothetical protein
VVGVAVDMNLLILTRPRTLLLNAPRMMLLPVTCPNIRVAHSSRL